MALNEIKLDFITTFFLNEGQTEKILLFEQKNKNIDNSDSFKNFLADLNRFYMYKFSNGALFNKRNIVKYALSNQNVSDTLKNFFKGGFLSQYNVVFPLKKTSQNADEFLITVTTNPYDLSDIFKSNRYVKAYTDKISKPLTSLMLFKYYREFINLQKFEQNKVIDLLFLIKEKKKNKFFQEKNKNTFNKYSYYSFFLFLTLYFQHINGENKGMELNKLLKENIMMMNQFLLKNDIQENDIYSIKLIPLNFFILRKINKATANIYNEFFSFSKNILEQQKKDGISEMINKNLEFSQDLARIKNIKEKEILEYFLDTEEYIKEYTSFLENIYKHPFIPDVSVFQQKFEVLNNNKIKEYTKQNIADYIKNIQEGFKNSCEYIQETIKKESLNFEKFSNILKKPFEKLKAEEVKIVDSVFRNYFLEKKENFFIKDKNFPEFLKKYLDYIEKFSPKSKSVKELFYKQTEIKEYETKKTVDEIFKLSDKIQQNIELIADIADTYYNSYNYNKKERDLSEINKILDILGIEPYKGNETKLLFKAINYVILLKKIRNPLIIKLYLEKENSFIYHNIFATNSYIRAGNKTMKTFLQDALYEETETRKAEYREYFDFSINAFFYNLINFFDVNEDIDSVILNKIFEKEDFDEYFYITEKNVYPLLKIKMLYEYGKEKKYSIEKLIGDEEERPIFEYLRFIDAFTEGKLKDAEKSFKRVEKYAKYFMDVLSKYPETFPVFRNFVLDKIGYYYSCNDNVDKVRKETVKRSGNFRKNLEKIIEKNKNSLFWNFLADVVFSATTPVFNIKSGIKKHYENISAILEKMSFYKIYNTNDDFIKKNYGYFLSLSKNIRGTFVSSSVFQHDISNSLYNNTDFIQKQVKESLKYMLYFLSCQYVPITYNELYLFYLNNFSGRLSDNNNKKEKEIILNLLLNNFKPFIIEITDKKTIESAHRVIKSEYLQTEKNKKNIFSIPKTGWSEKYWGMEIEENWVKREMIIVDNNKNKFYALGIKDSFGNCVLNRYENNKWRNWIEEILPRVPDGEKVAKIVLNKIKKNEYDFKNFIEFFSLLSETPDQFKKTIVDFFKKPLIAVKDKKISKDILTKVSLNKETFINDDKYFFKIFSRLFNVRDKNIKNKKVKIREIPVILGPLEYKEKPDEALKEAAGVFLVNFKNEIETVKNFIKETKERKVSRPVTKPGDFLFHISQRRI